MFNCPVVCNYDREVGDVGGHDVEIVRDYDNQVRMVNVTHPVGVVPESANVYFKEVEEDDGTIHEYLCCDVILWKRQEAYKFIKENGITSQSMEISVNCGDRVDDVYVINDFEFTAFALLGSSVEPCFESASLCTYSVGSDFKEEFSNMMEEFKETFNLATTSNPEVDNTKISEKGGSCQMVDENKQVFEENEVTVDEPETVVEDDTEVQEETFALDSNLREAIYAAFETQTMMTEWGEMNKYCICDYDTEAKMIYAWDHSDWLLYGFSYEMGGDNVEVDFDSKKRMKYVIAEFDEGETQDSPFAFACEKFDESAKSAKENISDLESKYSEASNQIAEMSAELEELRKFKAEVEEASDKAQRDELFSHFADLNDVEEFVELVSDSSEYSLESLEEKCFAIRGRNMKLNFSKQEPKAPKLPVVPHDEVEKDEPYGGVVQKYLHK